MSKTLRKERNICAGGGGMASVLKPWIILFSNPMW